VSNWAQASDSDLERVLAAWRLSPANSLQTAEPADEATIAAAERSLGRSLPDGLKALYRFSNGIDPLGGNLDFVPLTGSQDSGLVGLSMRLRSGNWPIPDELMMFGTNGAGDQLGLWYPQDAAPDAPTPVVMVGQVFEPASLALVGTDLPQFLRAWSGYYMVLLSSPIEALDALGLPESLREIDDEAGLGPYFRWADPALADPNPDPYERGLDAAGIAALIGR
jgi:hypothetical protein